MGRGSQRHAAADYLRERGPVLIVWIQGPYDPLGRR